MQIIWTNKEDREKIQKKIDRRRVGKMKKLQNLRNNKGITLIALIITVIVMLILAGVAINLTIGENGIFI